MLIFNSISKNFLGFMEKRALWICNTTMSIVWENTHLCLSFTVSNLDIIWIFLYYEILLLRDRIMRNKLELNTWYCPKPHPGHSNPQLGGNSQIWNFSLWSEVFSPHIGHPNPWDLPHGDKPSKFLALKTNGAYIQETQKFVGNWDSSFKKLMCNYGYYV